MIAEVFPVEKYHPVSGIAPDGTNTVGSRFWPQIGRVVSLALSPAMDFAEMGKTPISAVEPISIEDWLAPQDAVRGFFGPVFIGLTMRGEKLLRANILLARHLRVNAPKARIEGVVGWHRFRRSTYTRLIGHDENIQVG